MTKKAIDHLKKDPVLKIIMQQQGVLQPRKKSDLFISLLRAVVSQQLSVKAADTIWKRFLKLFTNEVPVAPKILKLKDDRLRAVGLSYQKAGYIKNIAAFSIEKGLDTLVLRKKSDEDLIDYLVQIKGVGRWTVEMILMFHLNRKNVFPKDDLGIQNGMKHLYGLTTEKKQLAVEMELLAEAWQPYRSLACMYIWRFKDKASEK